MDPGGMACGFALKHGGARLFFLPGVPKEMRLLFDALVLPALVESAGGGERLAQRTLRLFGISEARLQQVVSHLPDFQPGVVTAGFYALGAVTVFWMALTLSRKLAASFVAAMAYSCVSVANLLVREIRLAPEREEMDRNWRFKEAGQTAKEYFGDPYPVRALNGADGAICAARLRGALA